MAARAAADVVRERGQSTQGLPPKQICDIAAEAAVLLYTDPNGSDKLLEAAVCSTSLFLVPLSHACRFW